MLRGGKVEAAAAHSCSELRHPLLYVRIVYIKMAHQRAAVQVGLPGNQGRDQGYAERPAQLAHHARKSSPLPDLRPLERGQRHGAYRYRKQTHAESADNQDPEKI